MSTLHVRVELWNENTLSDDIIGTAEAQLPVVATDTPADTAAARRAAEVLTLAVDTGGTLDVAFACVDGP